MAYHSTTPRYSTEMTCGSAIVLPRRLEASRESGSLRGWLVRAEQDGLQNLLPPGNLDRAPLRLLLVPYNWLLYPVLFSRFIFYIFSRTQT